MSKYNGWANRETWLVNLHFGDYFAEIANDGQHMMADYMESMLWDMLEAADLPPLFLDMIDLGLIDWRELEQAYTENN